MAQSQTWGAAAPWAPWLCNYAASRRDNRYIQSSSYTQVCRHSHISRDLCAHLVVRSFLTREWRESNLLFSPSFSQICRWVEWTHPPFGAEERGGATLSPFEAQKCIFMHLDGGRDGGTDRVCRHRKRSPTGLGLCRRRENQTGVCVHFPLLCLIKITFPRRRRLRLTERHVNNWI